MKKETIIVKKRYLKKEKKRAIVRIGFLFLFIVLSAGVFATVFTSTASDEPQRIKFYTSVRIEPGDSLWSITNTYISDDYENREAYMKELCSLNHLMPDSMIHEGQYIVISYYEQINPSVEE